MIRIIVVEDDYHLNNLIKKVLEKDKIVYQNLSRKRDKKFKELINHREQIEYIILKK